MITISDPLKLTTVLDTVLMQTRKNLISLNLLGAVFDDIPRRGKNSITVPKYQRVSTASQTRAAGDSYLDMGSNYTITGVELPLNRNKIQALTFTNEDRAAQPLLDDAGLVRLGTLIADKLAEDVMLDILSVFNTTEFTGGTQGHPAIIPFDDLDHAEFRTFRKLANKEFWPKQGRVAILNEDYDAALGGSQRVLDHGDLNDPEIFREGTVRRISGFDVVSTPILPDNEEFIGGILLGAGALGIGFAPVEPTAAIRQQLFDYQVIKDESTGLVLEYKHIANGDKGIEGQFVEVHYGFEVFQPENVKLLRYDD